MTNAPATIVLLPILERGSQHTCDDLRDDGKSETSSGMHGCHDTMGVTAAGLAMSKHHRQGTASVTSVSPDTGLVSPSAGGLSQATPKGMTRHPGQNHLKELVNQKG